MTTYPKLLPPGTKVIISAGELEGTDYYYTGKRGVIEAWAAGCGVARVRFTDGLRSGPRNPALIVCHNIRRNDARAFLQEEHDDN